MPYPDRSSMVAIQFDHGSSPESMVSTGTPVLQSHHSKGPLRYFVPGLGTTYDQAQFKAKIEDKTLALFSLDLGGAAEYIPCIALVLAPDPLLIHCVHQIAKNSHDNVHSGMIGYRINNQTSTAPEPMVFVFIDRESLHRFATDVQSMLIKEACRVETHLHHALPTIIDQVIGDNPLPLRSNVAPDSATKAREPV